MAGFTQQKSRVPPEDALGKPMMDFLDGLDKTQVKTGQIADLSPSAALSDVISALNQILAFNRTR